MGTFEDYQDLADLIESKTKIPTFLPNLQRLDWPIGLLPSALSSAYIQGRLEPRTTLSFYLNRIDDAVNEGLRTYPDTESIVLVAHSIGGWIARAWLSEWLNSNFNIKNKIKKVVTLGSPHNPPPPSSPLATLDQTRGLLSYINNNYPGAYESNVQYTSVSGTAITGSLPFSSTKTKEIVSTTTASAFTTTASTSTATKTTSDGDDATSITTLESLLAYVSYCFLAGQGNIPGDGIIPTEASQLKDATLITIPNVKHTNYIPSLGASIRLPFLWYGSPEVIDKWLYAVSSSSSNSNNNKIKLK